MQDLPWGVPGSAPKCQAKAGRRPYTRNSKAPGMPQSTASVYVK